MPTLLARALALSLLTAAAIVATAQPPAAPEVEVVRAYRRTVIDVEIDVTNTSSHEVFIPQCGRLNTQRLLCTLAMRLQVHKDGLWKEPDLGCNVCGVPGGLALDKGLVLAPGVRGYFFVQFGDDSYRIDAGDEVRVVLDTWPDQAAMKRREKPVALVTAPFKLP